MKGFQEWLFIHDVILEAFCLFLDKEVWDITLHLRLISCFGDNIGEMLMTNQFIKKGFGLFSMLSLQLEEGVRLIILSHLLFAGRGCGVWDIGLYLRLISCFGDNIAEILMTNKFIKNGFGLFSTSVALVP